MSTNSAQAGIPQSALAACAEIARVQDRERWLAAGLAQASLRPDLVALIAFNAEVARTRDVVSEPMLGLIRLQWWRETIDAAAAGTPREHPVAVALAALLTGGRIARDALLALVDARESELDGDGFDTIDDFFAHADATAGAFNMSALDLLGISDDDATRAAARHLARAQFIVGQLRSVAANAARGRVLLPRGDLGGYGVSVAALTAGRPGPGLAAYAADLAARARDELAAARALGPRIATAALPVLVTARFAERHLARLEAAGYELFSGRLEAAPLALPFELLAALITRRW